MSGESRMENGECRGGLDFGAELDSLCGLAFGLYNRLAADFRKYNLVMTAHERGSVKALRDLSFNISKRINEMNDLRKKGRCEMNGKLRMENGECGEAAEVEADAAFKILNDVSAICEDAINDARGLPAEERARIYADAAARAAGWFGDAPAAATPKRDWLDMPGDFRLSRLNVDGRTKFVGVRHNRCDKGGNIYEIDVVGGQPGESTMFKIVRNGERIAGGFIDFGRKMGVERAAVGMLNGILAQLEKDRRHNKRNKQNRKARKAAEASAPAEQPPAMDLPRFPEDDE